MENRIKKNLSIDLAQWREIINDWEQSGESQKVYCERAGVSLNTFIYARNKLRKKSHTKTAFAPLVIRNTEETYSVSQSSIILENNRGHKLHFQISLPIEQLIKLLKLSGWHDA